MLGWKCDKVQNPVSSSLPPLPPPPPNIPDLVYIYWTNLTSSESTYGSGGGSNSCLNHDLNMPQI